MVYAMWPSMVENVEKCIPCVFNSFESCVVYTMWHSLFQMQCNIHHELIPSSSFDLFKIWDVFPVQNGRLGSAWPEFRSLRIGIYIPIARLGWHDPSIEALGEMA